MSRNTRFRLRLDQRRTAVAVGYFAVQLPRRPPGTSARNTVSPPSRARWRKHCLDEPNDPGGRIAVSRWIQQEALTKLVNAQRSRACSN